MPRGYAAESIAALEADAVLQAHLIDLELDEPTGTIRVSTAYRELVVDGETYLPAGHILDFGDVEETAGLTVNPLTVTYSGVDQSMIAMVLQERYIDRTLRIRRAFFDPTTFQILSIETLFEGRVNKPSVAEDPSTGTSAVSLEVANAWVDFERSPGRTTNHEQQQLHFPGDLGFEFAGNVYQDLPWGKEDQ